MARTTFISYKYSEAQGLRDRIIAKLGDSAKFYRGEDGFSDDLSSYAASTIKRHLSDMIYGTSVTIVILSPNMNSSRWIPWEIEYSLSEFSRSGRISRTNGVICVVQKRPPSFPNSTCAASISDYGWLENRNSYHSAFALQRNWNETQLLSIIKSNRNNKSTWAGYSLSPNYIDIVTEDEFLRNPDKHIEEAFIKSQNVDSYNITKQMSEQKWGGFYF
ncbi:MAG: TIR domain-containing protein [Firmicutes bacterium]|nr:TIR domain-containing protein [Bacillota bacterium]